MTRFAVLQALRPITLTRLAMLLSLAALCGSAQAQLMFEDRFNYPDGPILTAPSSPWTNNYLPSNEVAVVSGKLVLTQTKEESIRYPFPKNYSQTNLFAGFQVRFTSLPTGNGNYFAFFRAGGDTLFCRLHASTNTASPGKFQLGIKTISFAPVMVATDLSLGVTYDIVMELANTNDTVTSKLWINPISEADASRKSEDFQSGVNYQYASFGFKQIAFYENHENGMGDLTVDNLRIGFSFTAVRPPAIITSIKQATDGSLTIDGLTVPYSSCWLQGNTNLASTNWLSLTSAETDATGNIQFSNVSSSNPSCFYRLFKP